MPVVTVRSFIKYSKYFAQRHQLIKKYKEKSQKYLVLSGRSQNRKTNKKISKLKINQKKKWKRGGGGGGESCKMPYNTCMHMTKTEPTQQVQKIEQTQ